MFLSKIKASRPFQIFKINAAWIAFSATLLVLINAFSSLDEIRAYGFYVSDMVLSYAFLIFWYLLEALGVSLGLVLLQLLLEALSRRNLDRVFRALLMAVFAACWLAVLLAYFHVI